MGRKRRPSPHHQAKMLGETLPPCGQAGKLLRVGRHIGCSRELAVFLSLTQGFGTVRLSIFPDEVRDPVTMPLSTAWPGPLISPWRGSFLESATRGQERATSWALSPFFTPTGLRVSRGQAPGATQ